MRPPWKKNHSVDFLVTTVCNNHLNNVWKEKKGFNSEKSRFQCLRSHSQYVTFEREYLIFDWSRRWSPWSLEPKKKLFVNVSKYRHFTPTQKSSSRVIKKKSLCYSHSQHNSILVPFISGNDSDPPLLRPAEWRAKKMVSTNSKCSSKYERGCERVNECKLCLIDGILWKLEGAIIICRLLLVRSFMVLLLLFIS